MNLIELDELRAQVMRCLLDEEGRRHIWRYDIVPSQTALRIALADYDFDNIQAAKPGACYALIGGGIVDHHFTTPDELLSLLVWLCTEGYLSCHARGGKR